MFDIVKFGNYLSTLRKKADMTQSEVADRLNLTRQAISKYERGESFPDVSVLLPMAEIFSVDIGDLIGAGAPAPGEKTILENIAKGDETVMAESIHDLMGVAPLLKPSTLDKLSRGLSAHGIDISNIMELAEFLSDEATARLLENSDSLSLTPELIKPLSPFLSEDARWTIFDLITEGKADWHLLPYLGLSYAHVEAAVIAGFIPWEAIRRNF